MLVIIFLSLHSFQINSNHKDSISHVLEGPFVLERPLPQVDPNDLCERKCLACGALGLVVLATVAALSMDFYYKIHGHPSFQAPFDHIKMH